MGILQITGTNAGPSGVKIRYKLVETPQAVPSASVVFKASGSTNVNVLRLDLQAAEKTLKEVQTKVDEGVMPAQAAEEMKFERDTLAAELKGDAMEVARLKLQFAELELQNAEKLKANGVIPTGDYEKTKLARDIAAAEAGNASNTAASKPFCLRFLAWQDVWKTNAIGAVRNPDGSKVTGAEELGWLRMVGGAGVDSSLKPVSERRFLHLWFSYPESARPGLNEITLLDDAGQPIDLGGRASIDTATVEANDQNGNFGWLIFTLGPDEQRVYLSKAITVRLRYTAGPLEQIHDVAADYKGGMSLEDGSHFEGIGQNAEGRAFAALTVDTKYEASRRFSVLAVDKSGREISPEEWAVGTTPGSGVLAETFNFGIPLKDVAKFRIGSRPIRTTEWKDVVLPRN